VAPNVKAQLKNLRGRRPPGARGKPQIEWATGLHCSLNRTPFEICWAWEKIRPMGGSGIEEKERIL